MASTLFIQIPNIYVYPPTGDDENPPAAPWLCFDADDPFSNELLDEDDEQDCMQAYSPLSARPGAREGESTRSIVQVLLDEGEPEDAVEADHTDGQSRYVESGNDSEVVEVIKVRRGAVDEQPSEDPVQESNLPRKSSRFFAKAFRSMKFGKKQSKTRDGPPELPPKDSDEGGLGRQRTYSRASSVMSAMESPSHDGYDRPSSPSPSTYTTLTTRTKASTKSRRFSALNLNRLFSFSSQSTASDEPPPSPPDLVHSRDSLGPSTNSSTSSSSPSTPMSSVVTLPGTADPKAVHSNLPAPFDADESMEMRLDSLHFESLSFDPNEF